MAETAFWGGENVLGAGENVFGLSERENEFGLADHENVRELGEKRFRADWKTFSCCPKNVLSELSGKRSVGCVGEVVSRSVHVKLTSRG